MARRRPITTTTTTMTTATHDSSLAHPSAQQAAPAFEPGSHLDQQRLQLLARLEQRQAQLANNDQVVNGLLPKLRTELGAMTGELHTLCAERKRELLEAAHAASAWKCLGLKQLDTIQGKWRITTLWAWIGVLATFALVFHLLPPWGLLSLLLAGAAAVGVYRRFLGRARAEFARQASQQDIATLDIVGQYQLNLMRIGGQPSGNKDFPYACVQVAQDDDGCRDGVRNFDVKAFGELYGAILIGFTSPQLPKGTGHWLKLPEDGEPLRHLDVSDKQKESARFTLIAAPLARLVAQRADVLAQLSAALTTQVEQRRAAAADRDLLQRRLQTLASQAAAWRNVAVNRETLDRIVIQIELFKMGKAGAPKGMLLYGPPGTGKTSIARNLAKTSDCHFMAVNMAELKGMYQGHTAPQVSAVWKKARAKAPCILFVDECEGMFGTRSERSASGHNVNFDNELVETFLAEWDGVNSAAGQVFVIGATNRRDHLDNAMLQRFNELIEIGLPDLQSRKRILELELGQRSIALPVSDKMAKETAGMSGRDIHNLANSLHGASLMSEASEELFTRVVKQARGKTSTTTDSVTWDQVVLPARLKNRLEGLARKIKRVEEYAKAGLPVPKSLLLYGPPGTGKTQIARALATESGLAYLAVTTSQVKGSSLGESGKRVRQIFENARGQAPCLLFIDEIDIVSGARGASDSYSEEIVGQLLQEMDGMGAHAGSGFVFVLAATNYPDKIDEAVLSRFVEKYEVELPDAAARSQILDVLLRGKPLGFEADATIDKLARVTEGFSGRDLKALVGVAVTQAMDRADQDGLDIEDIRILEEDFNGNSVGGREIVLD